MVNTIGIGIAWVLQWKGERLGKNGFSFGRHAEVYDAEVVRICGELNVAVTSPMIRSVLSKNICTDNLNVAQQAGTIPNGSGQDGHRRFNQIAENWLSTGGKSSVQWIPAHLSIQGNNIADGEAKRCAENPVTTNATQLKRYIH